MLRRGFHHLQLGTKSHQKVSLPKAKKLPQHYTKTRHREYPGRVFYVFLY